ncbi:non-homologous end-joining DNA ligase [Streptomyces sp. L2]|uniref:non-homologous end-joining DNA ligase n=1 Tax=Streptomyces sp. L2 TaxID=2162665 RepID=UPI0010134EFA|nr:non-homologous end-joining DNA ligase [Streptomyces sp. L2]
MLATPGALPPAAQDARWAYETKQDGQRVMVYLPGDGSVRLRARSGEDITGAYPELRPLGAALGRTPAVLDGEVLALDERGRADFQLLQGRMGLAHAPARAARRAAQVPVHLVLFDVPYLQEPLTGLPYTRRRARLTELGLAGPHWSTPGAVTGHGAEALRATREHGLEGLVCKRLDSVYEPGVRSRAWIKIRNMRSEDVVIGGWLPGKGRLTGRPGAVLVGQRAGGRLRYVGGVGTGWSEAERAELAELLRAVAADRCPFDPVPRIADARWVRPRLVGEVSYSIRTRAGMLRQPSWLRLRPDLTPEESAADLPEEFGGTP